MARRRRSAEATEKNLRVRRIGSQRRLEVSFSTSCRMLRSTMLLEKAGEMQQQICKFAGYK